MNNCPAAHTHPSRNTVTLSTPFRHDREIYLHDQISGGENALAAAALLKKLLKVLGPQALTLRSNVTQTRGFLFTLSGLVW